MASDLLPQAINLFLHAHITNRVDDLLDSHLFINQMLGIRLQRLFALVQRRLKVLAGKRQWFRILCHQRTQLCQAAMESRKLTHKTLDLRLGVFICIYSALSRRTINRPDTKANMAYL